MNLPNEIIISIYEFLFNKNPILYKNYSCIQKYILTTKWNKIHFSNIISKALSHPFKINPFGFKKKPVSFARALSNGNVIFSYDIFPDRLFPDNCYLVQLFTFHNKWGYYLIT